MKRPRRTIPQEIKDLLDQHFDAYEDAEERQSNVEKMTETINSMISPSDLMWTSKDVLNYYYAHAKTLRGDTNLTQYKVPPIIFHLNSPCNLNKVYNSKNGTRCYYKCSTCKQIFAATLVADNNVVVDPHAHVYCKTQIQKECEEMTNIFYQGLQKATSLFKGNKSLGPSSCSEIIEQELPALKKYPMFLTDKVVKKAYSEVRKEAFTESIIRSSLDEKNLKQYKSLLLIQLYPHQFTVFCSNEQRALVQSAQILFVDGTFDETTPEYEDGQLLNFITVDSNGSPLPVIHALMKKRTEDEYINLFIQLKNQGLNFTQLKKVMCDFEPALINSLKTLNEGVDVLGCYFHYSSALYKYIQKIFVKNPATYLLFQIFKNIVRYQKVMRQEIIVHMRELKCPELDIFLEYYTKTWLNHDSLNYLSSDLAPDDPVTNNCCESFHSELQAQCQYPHPRIDKLAAVLDQLWNKYLNAKQRKLSGGEKQRYEFMEFEKIVEKVHCFCQMIQNEHPLVLSHGKLLDKHENLDKIKSKLKIKIREGIQSVRNDM